MQEQLRTEKENFGSNEEQKKQHNCVTTMDSAGSHTGLAWRPFNNI